MSLFILKINKKLFFVMNQYASVFSGIILKEYMRMNELSQIY